MRKSPQYRLYLYVREVEGKRQTVVLLGEAHTKSRDGSELGKRFLSEFRGDIGVEGVDWENFAFGSYIRPVIHGLHSATGALVFGSSRQETTTIDAFREAPVGDPLRNVIRLEKGHKPDLLENASLLLIVAMMARTGTELTYRGGKLVIATGNSLVWLGRQSPSELVWKGRLLGSRLAEKFQSGPSVGDRLGSLISWTADLPRRGVNALVHAPSHCRETVLQYLALSPGDPTRGLPPWKRLALKADTALKYSFTGVFGANIYLYFHPGIPIGLINNRNEEMVENGILHLDTQEEPRPLLVIAGMAHLKGWAYLLEKEGFREIK